MIINDFAQLAVLDAYKWWIVHDFGFLQLTGVLDADGKRTERTGKLTGDTLRTIARAYSVNRNVPLGDDQGLANKLAGDLNNIPENHLSLSLAQRAKALCTWVAVNPLEYRKRGSGEAQSKMVASAASKLTWFMAPEGWTIFDKFVGAAVLGKPGSGVQQMRSFYKSIADTWDEAAAQLAHASAAHGFSPLLGARIADKFLFLNGLGMMHLPEGRKTETVDKDAGEEEQLTRASVVTARSALNSFAAALPENLRQNLGSLGEAVGPTLKKAGWVYSQGRPAA